MILKTFKVRLTPAQVKQIKREWNSVPDKHLAVMIGQPKVCITNKADEDVLQVAIFCPTSSKLIHAAILGAKEIGKATT